MKRILVILGTRPEAIKMCKLIKELKRNEKIDMKLLSTGQHRSMLDGVLESEGIKADYDLSLMKIGQSLSYLTVEIINRTGKILDEVSPDFVLVHGDTVSAFAGALAAFYKKIPICHVEAGLRTYDRENPYPEEFYRCSISRMAAYHFAPTRTNKENLVREGIDERAIFVTGNTVIDTLRENLKENYTHINLPHGDFIILTAHRRENIGKDMESVFSAVRKISDLKKIEVVYPIHKNEKIILSAENAFSGCRRVKIIPPLDAQDFHNFLARCKFVITDSGGVQEESAFLGKPVLITRKCTERKEILSNCGAKLVGNDEKVIFDEAERLIDDADYYRKKSIPTDAFGDGESAKKIANLIIILLGIEKKEASEKIPFLTKE